MADPNGKGKPVERSWITGEFLRNLAVRTDL